MIASAIVSNVLIQIEGIFEGKYGDPHDKRSRLRDILCLLIVQAVGMYNGHNFGWLVYLGFRISLFDYVYIFWRNIFNKKKVKWSYVGGDSMWDTMMRKVNPYVILFVRIIIFIELITRL